MCYSCVCVCVCVCVLLWDLSHRSTHTHTHRRVCAFCECVYMFMFSSECVCLYVCDWGFVSHTVTVRGEMCLWLCLLVQDAPVFDSCGYPFVKRVNECVSVCVRLCFCVWILLCDLFACGCFCLCVCVKERERQSVRVCFAWTDV